MNMLPISVNIATHNEEKNIGDCIKAIIKNNPREIIVIDAFSSDRTKSIAEGLGARVVQVPKKGLAYQRSKGLAYSSQSYIAIVDAQDRVAENCFDKLLSDMISNNYDAIQAALYAARTKTYWERAYDFNSRLNLNIPGKTNMVGRPCIYKAEAIKKIGFDSFFSFGVGCEDVDISIQFEKNGLLQGKGRGINHRYMPSSFRVWLKKWIKYGKGDARIIFKYPEKKNAIRKHQLYGYPIQRAWKAIKNKGLLYLPFFILFGYVRFLASIYETCCVLKNKHRN